MDRLDNRTWNWLLDVVWGGDPGAITDWFTRAQVPQETRDQVWQTFPPAMQRAVNQASAMSAPSSSSLAGAVSLPTIAPAEARQAAGSLHRKAEIEAERQIKSGSSDQILQAMDLLSENKRNYLISAMPHRMRQSLRALNNADPSNPGHVEIMAEDRRATLVSLLRRSQLFRCYKEIRQFYKSGAKSYNKFYASRMPDDFDFLSEKIQTRSEGAVDSFKRVVRNANNENIRQNQGYRSIIDKGEYLFTNKINAGNCAEMASVAGYLAKSRFPFETLHLCTVPSPGDHGLIIVGSSTLPIGPIESWKYHGLSSDLYAIDVWLATACPIHEYQSKVEEKLQKWASENKLIITPLPFQEKENIRMYSKKQNEIIDGTAIRADNQQYLRNFLCSSCIFYKL